VLGDHSQFMMVWDLKRGMTVEPSVEVVQRAVE
jgi:hypothetical protein